MGDTRGYYSLSHPQKRIWYNEQIHPNTSLYNIGGMVRIKGKIDYGLLEQAIQLFIKKNEGLRLRIIQQQGEPLQYVHPFDPTPLQFLDFSESQDPVDEADKWAEAEFQKPTPLEKRPLYKFVLLKIKEDESAYFVKLHHIVADGWTILLMTDQISGFYQRLKAKEPINDAVEYSYINYLESERKYLNSPRFEKNKAFWNEKYQVLPDSFLPSSESLKGKRKRFFLEKETLIAVQSFLKQWKISLNTLFTTLMAVYMHKVHHQSDITIGLPVLNRSGIAEKKMVGMFTSTMPLRLNIEENESISALFKRVNSEIKKCLLHQRYPYNLLVKDLELTTKGYDGLFQYCVNYYNTKLNNDLGGVPTENVEFYSGYQAYSLQLVIKEWRQERLELMYDYKTADFSDEQIDRMHEILMTLLEQVRTDPEQPIQSLNLLTAAERKFVLEEQNRTEAEYPKGRTIQELFAEQVARTPEREALRCGDRSMTYRELEARSNQLARLLQAKGVAPGQVVGILATHSPEVIVAIWGVLKAGGAYLPIDPAYPSDRIRYILKDSGTSLLLTDLPDPAELDFAGETVDLRDEHNYEGDASNPAIVNTPNDPVYLIYTSGSTGQPKGVVIQQQGLVNYTCWAQKTYISGDDDVFALYSSISFDLTVTSIFTPLISGLKLVIYPESDDEFILCKILQDQQVTVLKVTPSHLGLLKNCDIRHSRVRCLIVGGENLKTQLAQEVYDCFGGRAKIMNEYGPTETVVGCMIHRYNPVADCHASVPIGRPVDNVQIYLLDAYLQPVPVGVPGEIFISGDGVAKGYLNRPALTAERFLENPFIPGKRMYRSGDLAVMSSDGTIEYLGRIDSQVKIKGYRIEPGEIESALLQHDLVQDAVVVDWQTEEGSKHLVAYVVAKGDFREFELRTYLAKGLPSYMIPAFFVSLSQLPLTPNGKVDRRALPDPRAHSPADTEWPKVDDEAEQTVRQILQEVLQTDHVEPEDNFYRLGGDSIKAIQVVSRLQAFGWKLRVKDVLNHPVVRELAAVVEKQDQVAVEQTPVEGVVQPTPIMRWFFNQRFKNPHHWNQSVLLSARQPLKEEHVNRMLTALVQHHDLLRLQYDVKRNLLYHNKDLFVNGIQAEVHDLSQEPAQTVLSKVRKLGEALKASLNLAEGPLFKAALFQLADGKQWLLLTAHHLVVDAVSWRILIEDANRCLEQLHQGQTPSLPLKSHSFQAWAEALNQSGAKQVQDEMAYWRSMEEVANNLSLDGEVDHDLSSCETLSFTLNQEETAQLLTEANTPYNTQTVELLLAALTASLGDWSGRDRIRLELEGHGREGLFEDLDISRTVGWFTTMYPLVLPVMPDISSQIKAVKDDFRRVPNKGIGYGLLQELINPVGNTRRKPIRFNYLGELGNDPEGGWLAIEYAETGREQSTVNHATTLLDIVVMVKAKQLEIAVTFSTHQFDRNSIERLFADYLERLRIFIRHCCQMEEREFTASDFETVNLSNSELDFLLD